MTPSLSRKDRTSSPPLPSHNIKPGRRRLWRWRPRNWTLAQALPLALLAMLAMSVLATALPVDETERLGSSAAGTDERLLRRATTRGRGILVDPRADARVRDRHADHPRSDDPYLDLRARDGDGDDAGSQSTTERIASRFTSATVTATPSAAATSSLLVESDPSAATELPAPFDTNLGNNFTSPSCPQFFDTFLNDAAFKGCLPLSLLLLNSQAFFTMQKNPQSLSRVLAATCNVVSANCENVMSSFATQLKDPAHCGADFAAQNPIVERAYNGFVSYTPLFKAGCLVDTSFTTPTSSGSDSASASASASSATADPESPANPSTRYCFASAVANTANPADSYLYYLPLGIALPGSSRPSCSPCTQKTMAFFADAARNLSSPLASRYGDAATQINSGCGPGWVSASVQPIAGSASTEESGAGRTGVVGGSGGRWGIAALVGTVGAVLLL